MDVTALLATAFVAMGLYLTLLVAAGTSLTARTLLFKSRLYAASVAHLLLSNEKGGWPKNRPDPDVAKGLEFSAVKRVVFVRHGESTWNEVFNRGFGVTFPLRLLKGLLREGLMLITRSSFFVDAPLSDLGYDQAKALRGFMAEHEAKVRRGESVSPDVAAVAGYSGRERRAVRREDGVSSSPHPPRWGKT